MSPRVLFSAGIEQAESQTTEPNPLPAYRSAFLRVQMAADQPGFTGLAVDSLGKGKLDRNAMLPLAPSELRFRVRQQGQSVIYSLPGAEDEPVWTFTFGDSNLLIESWYSPATPNQPLVLNFSIDSYATLLGLLSDFGTVRLPALLHFPNQGTLRITTTTERITLPYDALRGSGNFVQVSFPSADANQQKIQYRLDVVDIYPEAGRAQVEKDPRLDGYRRDFLSVLQLNPRRRVLANNSASDPCAFSLYMYSAMARQMPPLAEGLSALGMIRQTLDRYVGGMKSYGMSGFDDLGSNKYDSLDTYPSLVIATSDYVLEANDIPWLKRNYSVIKSWADQMIKYDRDGDGLMEYPLSGNSGSWPDPMTARPANWWDTIGFGNKDAYSNALGYRAFEAMAELAYAAGCSGDAGKYKNRAEMLKAAYFPAFYNRETGILAGWRSADGQLHDYYFLFVNGAAVVYGLIDDRQGNSIWDKLLEKMKEVRYDRFDLGLPGNLIPIRRDDYVDPNPRFGAPRKADGSDGFQIYCNGGATACFAFFTVQALRMLGRNKDADSILYPMLKSFEAGGFQGRGPGGFTYDWKDWNGNPHGYEGLLVDGFLTLLAAMPAGNQTDSKTTFPPTPSHGPGRASVSPPHPLASPA